MALLALKDIGKIYVSDGNVAVGIRGVNLSFDRGEFVAITGKSGSGKSTLLNVISGMDSYEEGELYVEGEPTSHYLQPDWEEYREKYVSFIFQDYNIIESFTVLQNVELALMHIEDKRERRARALELIDRVGLSSHLRHKGSRLSGGQKQRTVIARALAKDSPIILADEPTGNLDSQTSKEIISLLQEVSRDKLVIVVTHNFEQVAECATRHVRIFDGAVESDHSVKPVNGDAAAKPSRETARRSGSTSRARQIKNGLTLGRTIFTAKPRLSLFLCLLMIIGTLGIFLVTSFCGEAGNLFEKNYMFNHIDGRVVLAKPNGEVFTEEELERLVSEFGADSYLQFDTLLDEGIYNQLVIPCGENRRDWKYPMAHSVYGKNYGELSLGRYPTAANEVLLYLPIYYQPAVGKDALAVSQVIVGRTTYELVGVKYYYDNNLDAECLFTEEGFRTATAIYFLSDFSDASFSVVLSAKEGQSVLMNTEVIDIIPSFDIAADKIYVNVGFYQAAVKQAIADGIEFTTQVDYSAHYYKYNYYYGMSETSYHFSRSFTDADLADVKPPLSSYQNWLGESGIVISDELLREIAESVLKDSYKQASLFFADDKAAYAAVRGLQDAGYIAVPTDTTCEPDAEQVILNLLAAFAMALMWGLSIVFLAFFVNLCSGRALSAFKGEMAIMRSMGIQVKVIRIGMYVRMLLSLIPAFVLLFVSAIFIFTTPTVNEMFTYLYGWQYALIVLGMILLTVRTTHKQIRKLFGESVKKSLKGGSAE